FPHQATSWMPERSTRSASKANKKYDWEWPTLQAIEVKRAINTSAPKKAPGPDRINFAILQQAYKAIPELFDVVYTTLFRRGYHPVYWREYIGIILPKPGKPAKQYLKPKGYRIITLLNYMGKVLEKIYATRLSHLANIGNLLHNSQLGGRKQRSTIDTALLLLHNIQQHKANNNWITSILFLDIKGAFDHISKPQLLRMLAG